MRRDYNKLIRDRIPEIIQNSGKRCAVESMPAAEYRQALGTHVAGLSKLSVQTGTSHGGVVLPDGSCAGSTMMPGRPTATM